MVILMVEESEKVCGNCDYFVKTDVKCGCLYPFHILTKPNAANFVACNSWKCKELPEVVTLADFLRG